MAERRAAVAARPVQRLTADGSGASALDPVAVEEPLEIRVAGDTLAITMRTPGDDHELALGFLLAEGVIASAADVGRIVHCGRPGDPDYGSALDVIPGPGTALAPEQLEHARRGTLTTSACGVCGRARIDDLIARCAPLPRGPRLPLSLLLGSAQVLQGNQRFFAETGGLHAAAILSANGELLALREDVGRHNAVDKAVGALVLAGRLPVPEVLGSATVDGSDTPALLVVSGRVSFEIVQKALAARLVAIAGISAPSSLAIDLAQRSNATLAAFVRSGSLNLYCGNDRVLHT